MTVILFMKGPPAEILVLSVCGLIKIVGNIKLLSVGKKWTNLTAAMR